MFEDLIKEQKYYLCIGCSAKIKKGEVCPTCNLGGKAPARWEKGFYYAPYIPMVVIDCEGKTLEDMKMYKN